MFGDSYLTAVKWNDLTKDRVLEFGFGHLKKIRTKQFFRPGACITAL